MRNQNTGPGQVGQDRTGCVEPNKLTCWHGLAQNPPSSHPFAVASVISISLSTARFLLLHGSVQVANWSIICLWAVFAMLELQGEKSMDMHLQVRTSVHFLFSMHTIPFASVACHRPPFPPTAVNVLHSLSYSQWLWELLQPLCLLQQWCCTSLPLSPPWVFSPFFSPNLQCKLSLQGWARLAKLR